MSPRNLSHEPGDSLDQLILDARAELAESAAPELKEFGPDFAAVIEAAHARDPGRVPRAALDEALALAPIILFSGESSQRIPIRSQAEFGALLAEARAEAEAEAAAARAPAWSSVHVPKASPARPARRWVWALAAVAAAVVAVASPMLATRYEAARGAPSQAPWWEMAGGSKGAATYREPVELAPARPRPQATLATPPAAPAPELAPEPTPEPTPELERDPQPVPKARKPAQPALARESMSAQLRRLGGEAEQAWQAGDYAGAERLHRQIVDLAPGSRAADLSYGDLFTLARQRSGPEQEKALWREYLAAFPRGRYADDARAGLCRRAELDERPACWQQYLGDFPAGVHRTQAERALGDAP